VDATAGGLGFTDLDELVRRAERARRRVDEATTGSPDWDAAMAELEELEDRLTQRSAAPDLVELAG
jgi:phage shock protein A